MQASLALEKNKQQELETDLLAAHDRAVQLQKQIEETALSKNQLETELLSLKQQLEEREHAFTELVHSHASEMQQKDQQMQMLVEDYESKLAQAKEYYDKLMQGIRQENESFRVNLEQKLMIDQT